MLIDLEKKWLLAQQNYDLLYQKLEGLGWLLQREQWQESLKLKIDKELENRWLAEESTYRKLLVTNLSEDHLHIIQNLIRRFIGKDLPQNLIHQKIIGKLTL